MISLFDELREINKKPEPFQYYTAEDLWTDEHTSKKMLEYHLNESIDVSSRNGRFIDRSVAWIVDHFRLNSASEVVDFGCGPGLYSNKLASKNIKVTGIDFSQRSIDYARQQALTNHLPAYYIHKNYLEFESKGQFDLITMIMCDFCALSPAQRKTILGKFRGLLKPEGKILLDVYSLNAFDRKKEMSSYELNQLDNFWSPDDYYCFINTFKYEDAKVMLDKYTIVEKDRKRVVYNWLQHFSVESLKKEFDENNLIVEQVYSDVAGQEFNPESLEFAVVAKKE